MAMKELEKSEETIITYAREHNAGIVMLFGRKTSFSIIPIDKGHEKLANEMINVLSEKLLLKEVKEVKPNNAEWHFFMQIQEHEQEKPADFQGQGIEWTPKRPLPRRLLLALLAIEMSRTRK